MGTAAISKILVPVDVTKDNKGVLSFVQYVVGLDRSTQCEVVLLHALAPSFWGERLANIDFRARELADSGLIKGLRHDFVAKEIQPKMDALAHELGRGGVERDLITIKIEDGEPVDVIMDTVKADGFDAIALQRSCRSPWVDAFVGSVTSSLLLRRLPCPVYVVGAKLWDGIGQDARLMVAVDGSDYALKALEEAAVMARFMGRGFKGLILCHVSELLRKIRGDLVFDPDKLKVEGDAVLDQAKARAEELGISPEMIESVHEVGKADETLAEVARQKEVDILYLGRKGASALEEVFVGSVCRSILHHCVETTVALVG